MCVWNIFSEDISISYLPHVVNTCIVFMAYALNTHQNRLSETALVCIWNILSIDISHTKCFIAPHVLTEIIAYSGDSGECRKRDKPWLSVTCMSNRYRSKGNHPYRLNNPEKNMPVPLWDEIQKCPRQLTY